MIGLITNGKQFVFTLYNIKNELHNHVNVFQYSRTISILDIDQNDNKVYFIRKNLGLILEALENLDKQVIASE